MSIAVILPTLFITENPELQTKHLIEAKDFAKNKLNINNLVFKQTIKMGAFRKSDIYNTNLNFDIILFSTWLFETGQKQNKIISKILSVIKFSDCLFLGAYIENNPEYKSLNSIDKQNNLSEVINRTFLNVNTVKINSDYSGLFAKRANYLQNISLAEELAKNKIPVNANFERFNCFFPKEFMSIKTDTKSLSSFKTHRLIKLFFVEKELKKENLLPSFNGHVLQISGQYSEQKKLIYEQKETKIFNPFEIAKIISDNIKPNLHNLQNISFKIIKRNGLFVYLERGRSYGLQIGQHLVSDNTNLHVVQYDNSIQYIDVAIALIRKENIDKPLKEGDLVTIETKIYSND